MNSGKMVKWVENKGFGFLRMEGNFNDVFVHISAFGRIPRSPRVGDIVEVKKLIEENGKMKVTEANIQGLKAIPDRKRSNGSTRKISIAAAIVVAVAIAVVVVMKLQG